MAIQRSGLKVGVYVDVANLSRNGGYGMRFDVLRDFACRGGSDPIRLNAYVGFDSDRADLDNAYRDGQYGFFSTLRDFGYKVNQKNVKWYIDESGNRFGKANADLDLAVDALLQSDTLDRVLLATGDGDFVQVVRALQNKGCRVEVVAFDNVSADLRSEADMFMPGYLIPNLLPAASARSNALWGELGSRVRGVCYTHNAERGFGFFRFLRAISADLWKVDTRHSDSAFQSVFFHDSRLPESIRSTDLPSRNLIFEFDLMPAEGRENSLQAANITLASPRRTPTTTPPTIDLRAQPFMMNP